MGGRKRKRKEEDWEIDMVRVSCTDTRKETKKEVVNGGERNDCAIMRQREEGKRVTLILSQLLGTFFPPETTFTSSTAMCNV